MWFRNIYKSSCSGFIMINRKKFFVFMILGLFMISMMAGVLAGGENSAAIAGKNVGSFVNSISEFFQGVFGSIPLPGGKSIALANFFLAILLAMFVYTAIESFFDNTKPWIAWTATISVVVLALIGLPENFLQSVLTGYGAMGAAILMIVPFLIIFWFSVKLKSVLFMRGIWLFYTLYYFALYIQGVAAGHTSVFPNLVGAILGVVMFFFILKVHKVIFNVKLVGNVEEAKERMKKNLAAKDIAEETWRGVSGVGNKN